MAIGLSTYAFHWQSSKDHAQPMDLFGMIRETADLGVDLFQICDHPALETMSEDELVRLATYASDRNVRIELGTRGVRPDHLTRYLGLAEVFGATLVRSMLNTADHQPTTPEAIDLLHAVVPHYERQGVTIGLETYEQVATADLVDVVDAIDSPFLGICLDPANSVARLEMPDMVIGRCASKVVNIHVKDFVFRRGAGLVGFSLVGCPLGTGLLPFDLMMRAVRPTENNVSLIVEHWVPPAATLDETCDIERAWTTHNLAFLRKNT